MESNLCFFLFFPYALGMTYLNIIEIYSCAFLLVLAVTVRSEIQYELFTELLTH